MKRAPVTGAVLALLLLVLLIQVYLFETVLGAVLDGHRAQLPGALAVSAALTAAALLLAFKAPDLDGRR